jgi:hypothetical protein
VASNQIIGEPLVLSVIVERGFADVLALQEVELVYIIN